MSGIVKPAFGTSINWDSWAAKGLVASFPFNEGAGRTVYNNVDMSPASMLGFGAEDAANSGWVPGPHGGALAFDGINDRIDLTKLVFPESTPYNFSVLGSIKFTAISGIKQGRIFNQLTASSIGNQNISVFISTDRKLYYDVYPPSGGSLFTAALNTTDWYQFTVTRSGANRSLYIGNVVYSDSSAETYSGSPVTIARIGDLSTASDHPLNAVLNHLDFYSRALSPEEIAYLSLVDPYAAYRWDDMIYSKPFNQNFYRRLLAGGC
jgi:hypothetical protein